MKVLGQFLLCVGVVVLALGLLGNMLPFTMIGSGMSSLGTLLWPLGVIEERLREIRDALHGAPAPKPAPDLGEGQY